MSKSSDPVVINISCGRRRIQGAIGIDHIALLAVDLTANTSTVFHFSATASVDTLHSAGAADYSKNCLIL
jgi:hypothetical protein